MRDGESGRESRSNSVKDLTLTECLLGHARAQDTRLWPGECRGRGAGHQSVASASLMAAIKRGGRLCTE